MVYPILVIVPGCW